MQRDVAAAAVEQAKARVTTQQITLEYTRIDSPVSGRIGHSRFHVGSLVGPTSGHAGGYRPARPDSRLFRLR
ncbi:Efflux pump periplasmic linker BepF [Raoultella planticola]|uniref:Efflux pump periplasmic linker BepF n=1 Tax=Raoultella planticola TaxID=575 RepID=A0A485DDP1_RAOPL|nr:Efflux pump periplasmic linker BepF [Raoultella planticola]